MVILWEAQVSSLGLHSKRWLAHRNEFLPETNLNRYQKSQNQAICNVVRRRSHLEYATRPRLSRMYPWYSVALHSSMGVPSLQQLMLSMFSSTVVWPVSRLPVPRPRVFALQVVLGSLFD